MSVISDFLIDRVKANGWISVGNLMFEDLVPCINPISSQGFVCLSQSKELIFSAVRMDTHMSYVIEEGFLAKNDKQNGVQQTIICEPFDRLRQFDLVLFTDFMRWDANKEKLVTPKYPKIADVKAIELDPETDLAPEGTADEVTMINGVTSSAIDLYPDFKAVTKYVGMRVKEYKEFIKNQEAFCKFIGELTGVTDCI